MQIKHECFADHNLFKQIMDDVITRDGVKVFIYEKGTSQFPSLFKRERSNLSYEQAWSLLKDDPKLHKVMIYRDLSWISKDESCWDLGCCNISSIPYGELFIFISIPPSVGYEIIEQYNLKFNEKSTRRQTDV